MEEPQHLSFKALFKYYRRAAGLTQEKQAELTGYSVNLISKIEGGMRLPTAAAGEVMARALRLTPDEQKLFLAKLKQEKAGRKQRRHPTLSGRERELGLIEQFVDDIGALVLLFAGEPGIGKSRLLYEAKAQAQAAGWTVIEGGCHRRSGQEPFAPLVGALADYLKRRSQEQRTQDLRGCEWLKRLLPEIAKASVISEPLERLAPEQERRLMFDAVRTFLANTSGVTGTLLVLDDLQWAGIDALDLLAALARAAGEKPLRIIGAFRTTEVKPADPLTMLQIDLEKDALMTRINLGPLEQRQAEKMLGHLLKELKSGDRERLPQQILERAKGRPFFLVSFAQAVLEGVGSSDDEVPRTITDSIRQRIALLPSSAQKLLPLAAVIGREIPAKTFIACAARSGINEEDTVEAAEALCSAELLVDQKRGRYLFVHDLIREVVAADMSSVRRMKLHRQVAEVLEQGPGTLAIELLAFHYMQAEMPEKAVAYLERAADKALAVYANKEAARLYRMGIEQMIGLGQTGDAARVYEKLGDLLTTVGQHEEARAAYQHILDSLTMEGSVEAIRHMRKIANSFVLQRLFDEAARAYTRIEAVLGAPAFDAPQEWLEEWMQTQIDHMWLHYWQIQATEMFVLVEKTRPYFDRFGSPLQQTKFFVCLAVASLQRERYIATDASLGYAQRAWANGARLGTLSERAWTLFNLAFTELWYGALIDADAHLQEALALADRSGNSDYHAIFATYLTVTWRRLGRVEDVRWHATQNFTTLTAGPLQTAAQLFFYRGAEQGNLAWVAWRDNDLAAVERHGQAALEFWRQAPSAYPFGWLALWPLLGLACQRAYHKEAFAIAHTLLRSPLQAFPNELQVPLEQAVQEWDAGCCQPASGRLGEILLVARSLNYL